MKVSRRVFALYRALLFLLSLSLTLSLSLSQYMDDLPRGKSTDNELILWIINQLIPNSLLIDEVQLHLERQTSFITSNFFFSSVGIPLHPEAVNCQPKVRSDDQGLGHTHCDVLGKRREREREDSPREEERNMSC